MIYGNSELSYALYRSARTDISPGNFHLQRTVANDNSPLQGYNSPSASDVSMYVDRMIIESNILDEYDRSNMIHFKLLTASVT